ncbi:efflux RND transporter periplasmic adaptor subunit, partial [Escherichia coli]|nr:efflux RND transporter periplasmic adaptor subunit [Escherichia coli]
GLKAGERVVTDHLQDMRQDLKVEIRSADAGAAAEPRAPEADGPAPGAPG